MPKKRNRYKHEPKPRKRTLMGKEAQHGSRFTSLRAVVANGQRVGSGFVALVGCFAHNNKRRTKNERTNDRIPTRKMHILHQKKTKNRKKRILPRQNNVRQLHKNNAKSQLPIRKTKTK